MTPVIFKAEPIRNEYTFVQLVQNSKNWPHCNSKRGIIFSLCNQTFIASKRSRFRGLKEQKYTLYELEHDYKISNTLQLNVK